jgi:hypothetical protein
VVGWWVAAKDGVVGGDKNMKMSEGVKVEDVLKAQPLNPLVRLRWGVGGKCEGKVEEEKMQSPPVEQTDGNHDVV